MDPPKIKLDLPMKKGGAAAENRYAAWHAQHGQPLKAKYRRPKG